MRVKWRFIQSMIVEARDLAQADCRDRTARRRALLEVVNMAPPRGCVGGRVSIVMAPSPRAGACYS